MTNDSIKAGIIGAAGYTGGEMIRILLHHPKVEIDFCFSRSQSGKKIAEIHSDLFGDTELHFVNQINKNVDVVFLCVPHGDSNMFLENNPFSPETKIIDLSNDFRLKESSNGFIYGLPELNREEIKNSSRVANPGCFATAIQLALLPLAKDNLLDDDIHISAITGSTGAGVSLGETSHFTWRNNNLSVYKAFTHQHLEEIGESLAQLQPSFNKKINLIPYRGNFTRGIIATMYANFEGRQDDAEDLYKEFYEDEPFTFISDRMVDVKQVVNTNKCLLYLEKIDNKLMIVSVLDNLLKGASGQAVQNMNLMFGLDEREGLKLKPVAY
ncbi:MAG: N-acetyl-gamma-glutamyl-phosphate reductase, common form [Bacteroidota bacterium]|nr:N-acetyl-gamma-glutamyl-phosphate reductase, common form [Bacteroidota bacterium]